MTEKRLHLIILLLLFSATAFAQDKKPAFWNDIQRFKQQDSITAPPENAILLIGSSSFTMWRNVQQDFPGYTIINRGFGGSTLLDQIRYVDEIVFPYRPRQIIIYCGENDLAASDTVTGEEVARRFARLFEMIREKFPRTQISYVSMKPSPSRQLLLSKMMRGNELIKKFLASKRRTGYIDVYREMIDDEGKPRTDIFLEDNLHMNKDGYAIWKKLITPHLIK